MNKDGWNIENIYNYSGNLISTIKTSPDKTFEQNIRAQIVEPMKPKSRGKDKRLIISKNIPIFIFDAKLSKMLGKKRKIK